MLYHVKANQNFAKNRSNTKKFPLTLPDINIVGNKSSYWEVILISEHFGILRVASKVKIFTLHASDDYLPCF